MIGPNDPVLLDTGILVHLLRGDALGTHVDDAHQLRASAARPLICIVTVGEILTLAGPSGIRG